MPVLPAQGKALARAGLWRDSRRMEWRDEGLLLAVRPHGETAAIIEVFTAAHGRHSGVVRGGASRRMTPFLQPGHQLDLTWRARLGEHLGHFAAEPLRSRAAILSDRRALTGLNAVCALLCVALPDREPLPGFFAQTVALADAFAAGEGWEPLYLRWELALLEALGFGLDLTSCAVTGTRADLAYVSPRSGRAVSRAGAGEWADRLLPLPPVLQGGAGGHSEALALTGFFLMRGLEPVLQARPLPEARNRLADLFARDGS
ncbi:DNA repair protein RecO [Paracoccaceae bacterium]